jgi:peptide/nickel transport system permease protein
MLKHLSPNTLTVSFVLVTVTVGTAITVEAALSFLGIGITPPTPSWGNMLTNAQAYSSIAPHIAIAPGLIIAVVVLCVNLLGDTLRDVLDPRLKGR